MSSRSAKWHQLAIKPLPAGMNPAFVQLSLRDAYFSANIASKNRRDLQPACLSIITGEP